MGNGWSPLRVLFPSWKFFEEVGSALSLEYRIHGPNGEVGEWTETLHRPAPHCYSFLFNPEGNLFLAAQSLLQRLEEEIGSSDPQAGGAIEHTTSFQLVKRLVSFQIRERTGECSRFQFRIGRTEARQPREYFVITSLYERSDV